MSNQLYQLGRQKVLDAYGNLKVTAASNTNPTVITTSVAHGLVGGGETVDIESILGNTGANGRWAVTVTGSTTFSIPVDTTGGGAYTALTGEVLLTTLQQKRIGQMIRFGYNLTGGVAGAGADADTARDDHDDIYAILVATNSILGAGNFYDVSNLTHDIATHEFLSSVPVGSRIGPIGGPFVSKSTATGSGDAFVGGIANAANIVLLTVSGNPANAIVLYKGTGTDATSPLIAYIDTATGLPVTPNGGDITIAWDSGTNKIYKL